MKDSKKTGHSECAKMWQHIMKNEEESVKLLQDAVKRDNE